jgi:signal peptidase I
MTVAQAPAAVHAPPAERRRSVGARIGRALSTLVSVAVILAACLILVPTLLGYQRYAIVSGSMEPTIPTGSVVYTKAEPVAELLVGDIITFVPPAEYEISQPVTHRIIEITPAAPGTEVAGRPVPEGTLQIKTKGDANTAADPWTMVPDQAETARVEHHIPYLGYVYMALSNRWVQLLVIGLPGAVIAVLVCVALWKQAGAAVAREQAAKKDMPA